MLAMLGAGQNLDLVDDGAVHPRDSIPSGTNRAPLLALQLRAGVQPRSHFLDMEVPAFIGRCSALPPELVSALVRSTQHFAALQTACLNRPQSGRPAAI